MGDLTPEQYFHGCYPSYTGDPLLAQFYRRGIILGNYYQGINHQQMVCDCMSARNAIMESNVKIRQVGYYNRKLSYALSDIHTNENAQLVDAQGNVIQYLFGGHGFNTWLYNQTSTNDRFKAYVESKPLGPLGLQQARAVLQSLHYDSSIIRTVLHHLRKGIGREDLLDLAQTLLTPTSSPVGMVCAHAISERAGQLVLDAKHRDSSDQQGMKRLFSLLDRLSVNPTIDLIGPRRLLEQFMDTHRLKMVQDVAQIRVHTEPFRIGLRCDPSVIVKVEQELQQRNLKDLRFVQDQGWYTLELPVSYQSYRAYLSLLQIISKTVVSGTKHVKTWLFHDTDQNKLKLKGGSSSGNLYRWIGKQVLPSQVRVVYHDPIYAEKIGGVQFGRQVLFQQLDNLRISGLDLQPSYLSLLCDAVSRRGVLVPTTRNGILRDKPPLVRCAFQSTKNTIVQLALSGRVDQIKSPLSSVICGSPVGVGSGYFQVNL